MPEPTTPAGAIPAAGGATPPQSPPAPPAAVPPTTPPPAPATGDDDGLGEAGKRAIAAERKRADDADRAAKALQARIDELESASKTESERAIAQAKKEATDEVTTTFHAVIRQAKVEAALADAGVSPELRDLAAKAPEFADLKVNGSDVEGLTEAITAVKAIRPTLFAAAAGGAAGSPPPAGRPTGSADQGARGGAGPSLDAQIAEAQAKGDVKTAIHLKNRKLAELSKNR